MAGDIQLPEEVKIKTPQDKYTVVMFIAEASYDDGTTWAAAQD